MAFVGLVLALRRRRSSLLRVAGMLLVAVAMLMVLGDKILHQAQVRHHEIRPLQQLNLAPTSVPPRFAHPPVDSPMPYPSSSLHCCPTAASIHRTTFSPPDSIVPLPCINTKSPRQKLSCFLFRVCCSIKIETWPCCEISSPAFRWAGLFDLARIGFTCSAANTRESPLVSRAPIQYFWVKMELLPDAMIGIDHKLYQVLKPASMVYIQIEKKYHTNFLSSASINVCCSFVWAARLWLGPVSSSPSYDDGCQVLPCLSPVKLHTNPRLNIFQPQVFDTQVRPLQNLSSMQDHVLKLLYGFILLASSTRCGFHNAVRDLFLVAMLLHPCNRNHVFRPLYSG